MADAADAETETTHAFISYANQDRIIAEEVERQLTELAGKGKGRPFLKCFLDTKSIPPGQRYQPIIKSALEQADWLIVIFTGHQSVYSGYEIGLYSILHSDRPHEERPIICLHDVERSRLPAVLDGCNTTLVSQVVPNDPRDLSPSGEEVNLWFESPVGRLLRAICDSKELYTANDNPMQYTIDIARAAKKICSSFAPARGHSSEAHVETPPQAQPQVISFLYATNRRPSSDEFYFSGERADDITYGAASVQIPDSHRIGKIELPFKLSLFSLTLYEEFLDPQRHFIIKSVDNLSIQDWTRLISSSGKKSSLVFVHGFNTNYRDAVYRAGQIFWDLQYQGIPVLFSWPSRGTVPDYIYDRDSALDARDAFIQVLRGLRAAGASRIDILAHSMGNLVVLDSLASHRHDDNPLGIAEILMAAPDVAQDSYRRIAAKVRAAVSGMTLYASSVDRALAASKLIAGNIARAGDVPEGGPVLVDGIDAIDVTAIGEELFDLGHSPYATKVSILNDIAILINDGKRPPSIRLPVEISGMPSGQLLPSWWRLKPR